MKDVRVLKRYQNNKIYDTFQSCYVTLEEIAQIIREGNDIAVIDNRTKNDITYNVSLEVLINQERKNINKDNIGLLNKIIRSEHSDFTSYINSIQNN